MTQPEPHEMVAEIFTDGGEFEVWVHNPDDPAQYGATWLCLGTYSSFDEATAACLAGIQITRISLREREA